MRFRLIHYVPPTRIEHDPTDLQRETLKALAKTGETSLSDVLEALDDAPRRMVQDNLQTLRSLDLVELERRGRGARWRLTASVRSSGWSPGDVQRCFFRRAIPAGPYVSAQIRRWVASEPAWF